MLNILFTIFITLGTLTSLNAKDVKPLNYYFNRSVLFNSYSSIPVILNNTDLRKYYEIYSLQRKGDYKRAKNLIDSLDNPILVGYMEYLKFLQVDYNPSYEELRAWLEKHSNLGVSESVYKMAVKKARTPIEKSLLKRPRYFFDRFVPIYLRHDLFVDIVPTISNISNGGTSTLNLTSNNTTKTLSAHLRKGNTLNVKNILNSKGGKRSLDKATYDYYSSVLARSYFLDGEDKLAIEWGKKAIQKTPHLFPEAHFYLALSYYRNNDYNSALYYLSYIYKNHQMFNASTVSRASYWYAKISLLKGDIDNYFNGLKLASTYIYNFYGIIASEELGIRPNYSWQYIEFSKESIKELEGYETPQRAFALLQLGLLDWAEQELIFFASYETPLMPREQENRMLDALMYISQTTNMPALSYKLAGNNGKYYGLSHLSYPVFLVDLQSGYQLDPALILAIMRRESNFFSGAESLPGAKGLMQIMPRTATNIIERYNLDYALDEALVSPRDNVDLGQRYLQMLLGNPDSNNNLIYVIAGYNGGFSNVQKWKEQPHRRAEEPLFFIESIPFFETRGYVKNVMADYWVYQYKIGTPMYSLKLLIEGNQPLYVHIPPEDINRLIQFNYISEHRKSTGR